jgi:hypothetical protein
MKRLHEISGGLEKALFESTAHIHLAICLQDFFDKKLSQFE